MRKIILVRHAQSPFKNMKIKDFDRTLNKTGIFEANVMGNQIKKYKVEVDYIITSGANRALETCKIVTKCISYNKKILQQYFIPNTLILSTLSDLSLAKLIQKAKSVHNHGKDGG